MITAFKLIEIGQEITYFSEPISCSLKKMFKNTLASLFCHTAPVEIILSLVAAILEPAC